MSQETPPPGRHEFEPTTPEKYLQQAKWMLQDIRTRYAHYHGPQAVLVNALSGQIKEIEDGQKGIFTAQGKEMRLIVGLTFADLMQLQNGGTIEIPANSAGIQHARVTIFLGGTHEEMAKGVAKHPDAPANFIDTHGDKKN